MKNKDNIEIRIRQVWKFEPKAKRTVIGFYKGYVLYAYESDNYSRFTVGECDPTDNVFSRLISCPVLGEMSDWDIVTEEHKRDYDIPNEAGFFSWTSKSWIHPIPSILWKNGPCRVPRNFDWEPYRKDVENPTPPAGFRLVTREERDAYDYPTDCTVMWYGFWKWIESNDGYGWNEERHIDNIGFFAVPSDYVFKKESYGLPMDHVEKVRQQNRKDVDYCNTCSHDKQYRDGGTNCKGCDGDKFEMSNNERYYFVSGAFTNTRGQGGIINSSVRFDPGIRTFEDILEIQEIVKGKWKYIDFVVINWKELE